ncbi:hypothetical protein IM40_09895 (plasmid) [Candidatus Paracaedimonas acanthamoebae]|nr:hypothetical protein IM40_09895 [Candidatus Paracaedimonas acanthamoebae]
MFYVLNENRHYFIDTWNEVRLGDYIDPFSELNISLISHHQGFPLLNGEVPLVFIDDEEGLCGFAYLKPLEDDEVEEIPAWLLSDINLYISNSIADDVGRVEGLKKRYYTALRDAVVSILHPVSTRNIFTMSKDIQKHENLKYYTQLNFTESPQYTTEGILGTVLHTQVFSINKDVIHYCGTSPLVQ